MQIKLMLDLGVPAESRKAEEPTVPKRSIEDEVRDSLELIESDRQSSIEWRAIKGLYQQLCKMKQTERVQNLRNMIKPVLSKYGYHVE